MKSCPECSALLNFTGDCGVCGWARKSTDKTAGIAGYPCQDCQAPTNIKAGAIVVDGQYLCTGCHWVRLKARREEPQTRCEECGRTISEELAEYKQHVAKIMERVDL